MRCAGRWPGRGIWHVGIERTSAAVSSGVQLANFVRASRDRFFLCIESQGPRFSPSERGNCWKVSSLKKSRRCRINRPAQIRVAWLLFAAAGMAVLAGCRQDMHNQPKFIPLNSSEFYSDRRSARYPVPGKIPQFDDKMSTRNSWILTATSLPAGMATPMAMSFPLARILKRLRNAGARPGAYNMIASLAIRSWAMETA